MIALVLLVQLTQAAEPRVAELRALGRTERAAAVPRVASFLKDPNPAVRAEAIWALAQIAKDSMAADTVAGLRQAVSA